ncbi:hypothetical protein RJ639_009484 [Escallonia herrerae]|uniref:CCHC-type domain-containing protein n=1 Tax=Escallonia herrerae TaxID=1293975 RepID=A0AA88VTU5_9ASTE|nr:hypothetical protein RJ639_009484 [Escallonia herrerae]
MENESKMTTNGKEVEKLYTEPSIGMHFSKFTSAKEVWDYLEGLYMQSNFAKRYELENVIRGERQDDKSVQEFYNVMNGIWDQLDLMDPLELRKLAIHQKVREEQKLVQFLMALRTKFEPLRGSMLHRSPLPSVDKVLSELVAEETRLKSSLLHSMQTQAVLVATQRPQFLPLVPSRATLPSGNFRIALDECSFCHEKGHWKRDCPKLQKKDQHTGRQIGTGRRDWGLYFSQNLFVSPGIAENSALSAFQLNKHSSPFQLWHSRLGHVSGSRLKYMVSNASSNLRSIWTLPSMTKSVSPQARLSSSTFPSLTVMCIPASSSYTHTNENQDWSTSFVADSHAPDSYHHSNTIKKVFIRGDVPYSGTVRRLFSLSFLFATGINLAASAVVVC